MFLIGLTGSIASGKSTVSTMFSREYGIPVVDADMIARKVVEKGKTGWQRVKVNFGDEVLNPDQTINREKLGEIIFHDAKKRKLLNKCLHNLIAWEIVKQVFYHFVQGYTCVILDVPLLFEVKMALRLLSYKVVIFCVDENEQIRRLIQRNPNLTEEDALARLNAQMTTSERLKLADYSIDNSRDLEHTRRQVAKLASIFRSSKKHYKIRIAITVATTLLFGSFLYLIGRFL